MHTLADHSTALDKFFHAPDQREDHHLRVRAYYLWRDRGCPQGDDRHDWFTAEQQQLTAAIRADSVAAPQATAAPQQFTIRQTLAEHTSDPTHRFHPPGALHDRRLDVIAREAPQRVRAREHGDSQRPSKK